MYAIRNLDDRICTGASQKRQFDAGFIPAHPELIIAGLGIKVIRCFGYGFGCFGLRLAINLQFIRAAGKSVRADCFNIVGQFQCCQRDAVFKRVRADGLKSGLSLKLDFCQIGAA